MGRRPQPDDLRAKLHLANVAIAGQVIQGDVVVISHGTREMPIYGDLFRGIRREEIFVKQRVGLLTGYIESLQK